MKETRELLANMVFQTGTTSEESTLALHLDMVFLHFHAAKCFFPSCSLAGSMVLTKLRIYFCIRCLETDVKGSGSPSFLPLLEAPGVQTLALWVLFLETPK